MPVFCCGKMRKANFCPECGGNIRDQQPLIGLLYHCQASLKRAIEYSRPDSTATIARWRSWVEAVRAVLDEKGVQYFPDMEEEKE